MASAANAQFALPDLLIFERMIRARALRQPSREFAQKQEAIPQMAGFQAQQAATG